MIIEERLKLFLGSKPQLDSTAYVAPGATLLGDVVLGKNSNVWPGCVVRADINSIHIGEGTNIQDGVVIHVADENPTKIGDYVTVGHSAVVHACTIEDEVLVGMHATILDGAVIGKGSIIGAHTLIKTGMKVPAGSMVLGIPGVVVRPLRQSERRSNRTLAEKYICMATAHRNHET